MSTRIALSLEEWPHHQLARHNITARVVRLTVDCIGWNGTAWVTIRDAWIDTGAPFTMLPEPVWRRLATTTLARDVEVSILGAAVRADFSEVGVALTDGSRFSPALTVRAFCCYSDRVPILIGIEDVLTRGTLHCTLSEPDASYLELP